MWREDRRGFMAISGFSAPLQGEPGLGGYGPRTDETPGEVYTMNKAELIDAVADRTGIAKSTVDSVIKGMTETIEMEVAKGDKIQIPGFISFQKVKRAARTGRNPQTGETIQIPASSTVKVTAGARLKASVAPK
jgi:DNA-binding protein HU-beta